MRCRLLFHNMLFKVGYELLSVFLRLPLKIGYFTIQIGNPRPLLQDQRVQAHCEVGKNEP